MIADFVVYCLRGRAPDSTGFRQSQAGEGYFRFPDIYLDGRDLGFEVVDDHAQFVVAGREVGRKWSRVIVSTGRWGDQWLVGEWIGLQRT